MKDLKKDFTKYNDLTIERGKSFLFATPKNILDEQRRKKYKLILLSFLIPILAYLPAFLIAGIFPFGDNTTLAVDLRNEYVGFYEAFRHALSEPGGFFYNASKSLGGEMVGTFSYYMMSPFNFLFFLLPREYLPYAVQFTQMLKVGLAGASFSTLLIYNEHGRDWKVVLFSSLYALISFITANLLNHMWLDPIAIFPLVILGLEGLIDGKGPVLYVISLALMIWTNFYIAYMGCILVVIYFIYTMVRRPMNKASNKNGFFKQYGKIFLRFAFYSLLAGAICAVLIFPTISALIQSKGAYAEDVIANFEFDYPPLDILSKFLPGAFNYDQVPSGLPNIFAGTIPLIFLLSFFFNNKIKKREKIISALILIFLFLSLNVDKLNTFWHGMQYPVWYEWRFSWGLSFFVILFAFRAMQRFNQAHIGKTIVIMALYALLLVFLSLNLDRYDFLLPIHILVAGIIFIGLMIGVLLKKRSAKAFSILLCFISFIEISGNTAVNTVVFNYESHEEFQFFDHTMREASKDIIPKEDDEFWRIEKTFMHDNNDGMRFGYPTITHFNSALERDTVALVSNMGFAVSKNSVNGTNPTKITDAFYGIRYYLDGKDEMIEGSRIDGIDKIRDKSMRPDLEDYNKIAETDYVEIYENPNAMPLGLLAEDAVLDLQAGQSNPMDFQDRLFNLLDNKEDEVNYFVRLAVSMNNNPHNLDRVETDDITTTYVRQKEDQPAYLDYRYLINNGSSHYLSVSNTLDKNNSKIYLKEREIPNKRMGTHYKSQVYNVASQETQDKSQNLKVYLDESEDEFKINNISLFYLDEIAFQEAVDFQQNQGLKLSKHTDTLIEGSFTANEQTPYLLLTIPYDEGWTAYLDGEEVETMKVLDSLTAISVGPGDHDLRLEYSLPYFKIGTLVSVLSILIFISIALVHRKGKNNEIKDQ